MKTLQTQHTPTTPYIVRLRGKTATFIWSSTPDNPLRGSVDLKVKISPSELLWLAKNLNCPIKDNKIFLPSLDLYNRLLIYACIRPALKSVEKIRSLTTCVLELNSWDALYWASRFRELWWNYEKLRNLKSAVKAFKLFFNIH